MKESSLRASVTKAAKHFAHAHVTNVEDRTGTGIPDTILGNTLTAAFLELKVVKKQSPTARLLSGRLRPNQAGWLTDATKRGMNAWIVSHFVETGRTYLIHGSRAREYNNNAAGDIPLLATATWRGPITWPLFFSLIGATNA